MNAFEVELEDYHRLLFQQGFALVEKIPTALAVLGQVGRTEVRARFTRRKLPDYIGITQTGTPVAFEAKESRLRRFDVSVVKPHQLSWLSAFAEMGGRAFVLARCNHAGPLYGHWFAVELADVATGGTRLWRSLIDVTRKWFEWISD